MDYSEKPKPRRLDIYLADLPRQRGSIQYGYRPVIILQNDRGNESSTTVIVVPLTGKPKYGQPTHAIIGTHTGVRRVSTALCEQIQTIPMDRLTRKIGKIAEDDDIQALHRAINAALGMD